MWRQPVSQSVARRCLFGPSQPGTASWRAQNDGVDDREKA
jgi:hypothetical protein